MKFAFRLLAVLLVVAPLLHAQDLSGVWQATVGSAKEHHRLILDISKTEEGSLKAEFYLIDDSPDGFPLPSFTQKGAEVSFELPDLKISYKGTLAPDGNSIAGQMIWDGKGTAKFVRATPETAWPHDVNCACSISFVPVEKGVKLEVLDWGGSGRPLILLAGLGDSAHVLDGFAHKLAGTYHVYGITRRGAGDSSAPAPTEANYNADRLGDDVIAVIDALHLKQRPVLVGHSIAGEELSSVGSRHPEKVAGLVYLDAGYEYAIYDRTHFDIDLDTLAIRKQLDELLLDRSGKTESELLAELPEFEKELAARQKETAGIPVSLPDAASDFGPEEAIQLGERKYTEIKDPVLAIFANPHKPDPPPEFNAAARVAYAKFMSDHTTTFVRAFQTDVPGAEVVSIPNADHYVFQSNEAQVLSAMNGFLAKLPN